MVDVRSHAAYLRAHLAGSASIPAAVLEHRLFLLPPRDQPLVAIARDARRAREAARILSRRGWTRVAWMDGAAADFPGNLLRSGPESVRLWRPARMLSSFADLLPHGGRALDLACGSGRNAAFLALRGADALGVDLLPDALRQARTLARASGLRAVRTARRRVGQVAFRRADLTDARVVARLLPPGRWQAITCFRYLDRALLPRIAGALAPGGVLFYQTFLEAQARLGRKPRRPAFLLKPGELRRAFASLEIIHYEEGPDERGDHHASLVARAAGPERR